MTTFCEREDDHECRADLHVTPETTPRRPYATRLEVLHEASESLQVTIGVTLAEMRRTRPEIDPYTMQHGHGPLILAPMLADQIVIQNQIEKLEREEHTRAENLKAFEAALDDNSRWIQRGDKRVLIPENCLKGEDCVLGPHSIIHAIFCPAAKAPLMPFQGIVCLAEVAVKQETASIQGPTPASKYLCTNARPCPDHPEEP